MMMTLLVRRRMPDGGKVSTFHRFGGQIEEHYHERGVELVVHGVLNEKAEATAAPVRFDLPDGDEAHVVGSDGVTVTSFRWRPPFSVQRGRRAS